MWDGEEQDEKSGDESAPTEGETAEAVDPDASAEPGGDTPDPEPSDSTGDSPPAADSEDHPAEPPRLHVIDAEGEILEAEEPPSPQEAELEMVRGDLAATQARLRAVSKAYQDNQAEMKAFRERMEARAKFDSERQTFDQVKAFFDPVMNLRRSLSAQADVDTLMQGLKMVEGQFMSALERLGLSEVPGIGATFDPQVHEALAVQPVTDPEQDGKVLMVHTNGFTVNGKVLQAAQVVIGKHQEAVGEA